MAESLWVRLGLNVTRYISGAKEAASATGRISSAASAAAKNSGSMVASMAGIQSAAKFAAGSLAAVKIGQFAADSLRAASDLRESANAVKVTFGSASDALFQFGQTVAETSGLAQSEFQQLAVTTGSILQGLGLSQQEAAEQTVALTQRAADLASVFNTDVKDALFATTALLRGETLPARRYGIVLDDAALKAKALALGLAETSGEITRQQKGQAALALLMEQTNRVAGDFARTSGDMANRQRRFSARLEDTKAKLGDALMPAMMTFLEVGEDLLPTLENLVPVVGGLAEVFKLLAQVLGPVIDLTADYFDLVGRGSRSLRALLGSEKALAEVRAGEAQQNVADALERGNDAAVAYANSLNHLVKAGALTAEQVERLADGVEFVGDQQAVAIARNLEWARSNGAAADQIRVLEDALVSQIERMDLTRQEQLALLQEQDVWVAATRNGWKSAAEVIAEYTDVTSEANQAAADAGGAQADLADKADDTRTAFEKQADAIRDVARAQKEASDPLFRLIEAQRRIAGLQERRLELAGQLAEAEAAIAEAGSAEQLAEAQQALADAQQALSDNTIDLLQSQQDLESAAADAAGKLPEGEQALFDLAEQAGVAEDEIRDLIRALAEIPSQVRVDLSMTRSGADLGQRRVSPNLVARQHGGGLAAGQMALVGEQGPELFVPHSGGTVVPAGGFGGGNTVQVFVESLGSVTDDVQLGLLLGGITEEIEWAGSALLEG